MSDGKKIYQAAKAGRLDVVNLSDWSLVELSEHIVRRRRIGKTAARIAGEAMAEAFARFARRAKAESKDRETR